MKLVPYSQRFFAPNLLKDFFNDDFSAVSNAVIKTDIKETDESYIVEAEMPGVKKEDVTLVCEKGVLAITAKRSEEKEEDQDGYIRRERYSGQTSRSFALKDINEEDIKAKLDNGVLYVTLPKITKEELQKKIEIE